VLAGEAGFALESWEDHQHYLVGYSPSQIYADYPGLGWSVIVRQHADLALRQAANIQQFIVIWGVLSGVLLAGLVWRISRGIIHPMLRIANAAEKIRRGERAQLPVFDRDDEIGALSQSIQNLVTTLIIQKEQQAEYRQQIETYAAELETRVAQRTADLQLALAKAKELNELKTYFSSMISHEFRTPLTVIASSSGLMQRYYTRMPEEKRAAHLEQIQNQVKRLAAMLDDVLTLSKADTITLEVNRETLNLRAWITDIVDELRPTAPHHTLDLSFIDCPAKPLVAWDATLMRQAIYNLLSNAIKYSPDGGTVRFSLTCDPEEVMICVQDQGIGIPEKDQQKLFEVFHRAGNVGTISGTGLGLPIVKRAVDAHNGTIKVESIVRKGTTFTLVLPRSFKDTVR
jgi:signal transduction histidine kinase